MIVGIDSGYKMKYTAMVSGSEYDLSVLYFEIEQFMKKEGINPPFHWTSIKSSRRESLNKFLEEILNKSKVNFTIIIHKDKSSIPIRELIYELIPKVIAESLAKWAGSISGRILFEVDNDFSNRDTKSKYFVNKIFTHLIPLLTKAIITIRESNGVYLAQFKHAQGTILLIGRVSNHKISKAIQIADLLTGCYRQGGLKIKYERMFIKKLC